MKSEAYAYAKWILITFNNFKKTKKTERTHTHTKKIYSANLPKVMICSLRARSCLFSSVIFFQLKEIIVDTTYWFFLCKNKAFTPGTVVDYPVGSLS